MGKKPPVALQQLQPPAPSSRLRIWKDFTFCAAHSVASLPDGHKCRNTHGHNYRTRVYVEGRIDMATGFCAGVDFDQIKAAWKKIEPSLDHGDINKVLGGNATTEHLAIYIMAQMRQWCPQIIGVQLWETDTCGAEFFA